jgi:methylated-DNA-[protein]-cysteine S-methyltransferase
MAQAVLPSPIGMIRIDCDGRYLRAVTIGTNDEAVAATPGTPSADAAAQIAAYLAGDLQCFDLPLAPMPSLRVAALRRAVAEIPFGSIRSYGEVAKRCDSGPRAIGQACRINPFPIIIPCHRVVGTRGAIGHYSAGNGVKTKYWLLNHERGEELWER